MKIAVLGVEKILTEQDDTECHCQELYAKIAAGGHQVDLAKSRVIAFCNTV